MSPEMCQQCESTSKKAFYMCTQCIRLMCRDCNNEHSLQQTSSTHKTVLISSDYNFQIKGIDIRGIASLSDGTLILCDPAGMRLLSCGINCKNIQYISMPYRPTNAYAIDQNTVTVTAYKNVLIVDVRKKIVTKNIDINERCNDIMHSNNHLYVGCDKTVVVVDMSGNLLRTVSLSFTPWCICSGTEGRIYCADNDTVYCIGTEGNTVFTVTNPDMSHPWDITTDHEGSVLVTCALSPNVHKISSDGKQCNVIIADMPISLSVPYICYDSFSKSIVIGATDTVFVYKI